MLFYVLLKVINTNGTKTVINLEDVPAELQFVIAETTISNAEAVEELQSFVSDYFNNLDVTEEIERIKSEVADISCKMLTGKTVEELVKEILDEIKRQRENEDKTIAAAQIMLIIFFIVSPHGNRWGI